MRKIGIPKDFTKRHEPGRLTISLVFQVLLKHQNPDFIVVKTDAQTPEESIDYLFEQLKSKL